MNLKSLSEQDPKARKQEGFTLIELLVVIIIIGILAGIAVIGVQGAQNAASKRACQANATQVIKGLRAYYTLQDPASFPLTGSPSSPYDVDTLELYLKTGGVNAGQGGFLETIPAEVDVVDGAKYRLTVTTNQTEGSIKVVSSGDAECGTITG